MARSSAGKAKGSGSKKIGNAHLKWAFSEAACLMIRAVPAVKAWVQRQEKKRGKRKAVPAALSGTYTSADSGAVWKIAFCQFVPAPTALGLVKGGEIGGVEFWASSLVSIAYCCAFTKSILWSTV